MWTTNNKIFSNAAVRNFFKDHPEFTPDLTPQQIFSLGAFGGGYFRPIHSAITDRVYQNDHLEYEWGKTLEAVLVQSTYDSEINCYPCVCGTSLEFWQSKNWIRAQDPRGWVQWYCRFFNGRRSADDKRQINRWKRIQRFKKQLITHPTNKLKQTFLHWAYDPELILQ